MIRDKIIRCGVGIKNNFVPNHFVEHSPVVMKKSIGLVLVVAWAATGYAADVEEKEKALRVIPLVTSSPLLGLGVGGAVSYLYDTKDGSSSKSQLQVGGQYSNTDSLNLFIKNNAYFMENRLVSTTAFTFSSVNNEFPSNGQDVEYNVASFLAKELLMYEVANRYYLGGELVFKDIQYDPNNAAGADFIDQNGILDERNMGVGLVGSYDSRENKYYPSSATWITAKLNSFPEAFGAVDSYYSFIFDGRYYAKGFSEGDVWAWQFYGQYGSEKTPDTGLPTLSGKSLLRGFPAGQFKARYLSGGQSEYRYAIKNTKFRISGFFGIANLAGGSYGDGGNSREDDGWYSAGGVGLRYAIQPKTGVDLRLDLVTTSENEQSLYLMLNQAF